jgi:nickel/cobalt exporter
MGVRHALFAGLGLAALAAGPALAHPHIFIDATVEVGFGEDGALTRIVNRWTFDPYFSAWQVQGLDTDGDGVVSPEEMQELADETLVGLSQYHFYTFADSDGAGIDFVADGQVGMRHDGERVTLEFTVSPEAPVATPGRLELAINDPEYYVAIAFEDESTVTLVDAPADCAPQLIPPEPMSPEVEEQLYSLGPEVLELPPELAQAMMGTQGMIVIACPQSGGAPLTAAAATQQLAEARPAAPFGGPPPEPGLNLPQTGFFGWLQAQQREFYRVMTDALGAFRSDASAFWLLGLFSFVYGVLHAAGPGHGKVVIGAYMLANERAVRHGIALSFASAMMQSLVAIAFVLIAAGIIGLTSLAMADAAHWIGVASYVMIMALGLWLMVRKLFGFGHSHAAHDHHDHHAHDHHDDHDHDHDHDHAHHHVVPPDVASRPWREQLGVVLAVGLRPCSGALVVLAFALSQGVVLAGIGAVLLMGLGTGLTVAALASLAVWGKALALKAGGLDNPITARIATVLEIGGAFAVFLFGLALLMASL